MSMDYGCRLITRAAVSLRKGESAIDAAVAEYRRILNGQDPATTRCHVFQQIATLSAIESVLKDSCAR
jgi:hypothetical protein